MSTETQLAPVPLGQSLIEPRMGDLLKVIPDQQAAEAFARIAVTAISKDQKIQQCSKASILACVFDLAAINLPPNTPDGYAYLIPYGNELTVQIGYKGFCHLAYRSGQVSIIKSGIVRDGDTFEAGVGTGDNAFVKHVPAIGVGRNDRPVLAAWAAVEMMNGGRSVEIVDQDELVKIERFAKQTPAWKNWADQMRRKAAIKRLLKALKITGMETVAKAIEIDNERSFSLPIEARPHRLTFGEDDSAIAEEEPEKPTEEPAEPPQSEEPSDEKGFLF